MVSGCHALQKNIFVSCAHFSSSIIPCDTIKVPGWKDKKMIDHPFAWPLRNNLRCKWNVYCYFRKSPWNDLYTVFNRILLKANVTIASSNLFAKKKCNSYSYPFYHIIAYKVALTRVRFYHIIAYKVPHFPLHLLQK